MSYSGWPDACLEDDEEDSHNIEYLCTECGGDAYIAYAEGWNGKVKKGERLCTGCFTKRGGERFF